MRRTYRYVMMQLVLLGLCCPMLAMAAEDMGVIRCDLRSCIRMAIANHPMLKAGEAKEMAARSEIDVRLTERKPSLTLEGESGYLAGQAISPFSTLARVTEEGVRQRTVAGGYYLATLGVQVPLVKEGTLIGQAPGSVREARFKVFEQDWENRFLRLQLAGSVADAYVQILKSRSAIKIQEEIVAAWEEGYKLALAKFNQNLIARKDLLSAEVQFAAARRDLSLARLTLRKSQQALVSSIGLNRVSTVDIQDLQDSPTPLLSLQQLLARVRETHPEIKARAFSVKASAEAIASVQSGKYPTVSFNTNYSAADPFEGRWNNQWSAAIKVTVPIFNFGLIDKKLDVARANLIESEQLLQASQANLTQQISDLYIHIQELDDQIELINKQIEQATEEVKVNEAMFKQDLLSSSALLESQAVLSKLRLALSDAEYDRRLARFQLKLVSGEWDLNG